MDNNVIRALAQALVNRSIIAFRFNFRGVGRSEGGFGGGVEEQTDVAAALDWLSSQSKVDTTKIGVAGYSFGAAVALPISVRDERVKTMAFVSLPLADSEFPQLKSSTKPKFFIWGDSDFIALPQQIELFYRELSEPKELELVSGADHFWWGLERELAEKISAFFQRQFQAE